MAKVIKMNALGRTLDQILARNTKDIFKKVDKALRISAIKVWRSVIKMTPVAAKLGGRARANWFIGASVTTKTTLSKTPINLAASLPKVLLGKKTFLYNNLPYITTLEFGGYPKNPKGGQGKTVGGFSKQAPRGMVRVSLKSWSSTLNAAFKSL